MLKYPLYPHAVIPVLPLYPFVPSYPSSVIPIYPLYPCAPYPLCPIDKNIIIFSKENIHKVIAASKSPLVSTYLPKSGKGKHISGRPNWNSPNSSFVFIPFHLQLDALIHKKLLIFTLFFWLRNKPIETFWYRLDCAQLWTFKPYSCHLLLILWYICRAS